MVLAKLRYAVFASPVHKQKPLESAVLDYQDTDDPEYEDFRAEANLQRKRQLESFAKAGEAFRQGRKEVASFYAQQVKTGGRENRFINSTLLCFIGI